MRYATLLATGMLALSTAWAADHAESPATNADRPADIADVFFFDPPDTSGRLVGIITYGGASNVSSLGRDAEFYCDRDVLYSFFLSRGNAGNLDQPEVAVRIRMAQTTAGCAVRIEGLPGVDTFEGVVAGTDRIFQSNTGLNAFVGSTDDPFFFDFQGFGETLSTGTLAISNTRDSFAGRNLSAIAFEMDTAAVTGGASILRAWATTARFVE